MIQALDLNGHLAQRNKLTEALWILAFANGSKVAFQAFLMWVKEQTRLVCQTAQFWSPYIIFAFIWLEDFQNAYNVLKFWCRLPCIEHVREMSHQLHPWEYLSMANQPHSSQFQGLCLTKRSRKLLQNLPYFWNKKTQIHSCFFHFEQQIWQILKRFSGAFHWAQISYFWRALWLRI